jgi:hypothetical protein
MTRSMVIKVTTRSWTATVATTCSMADPATTVALPLATTSGIAACAGRVVRTRCTVMRVPTP